MPQAYRPGQVKKRAGSRYSNRTYAAGVWDTPEKGRRRLTPRPFSYFISVLPVPVLYVFLVIFLFFCVSKKHRTFLISNVLRIFKNGQWLFHAVFQHYV